MFINMKLIVIYDESGSICRSFAVLNGHITLLVLPVFIEVGY